ncbi:ly6/PLAUR domain-containing protein 8 [Peromyscus californicus insignis]|uniref:ly6/PLAUR domain-containing protein 8 n=1 Tax=Peromyscus californicus insignis TaxID=564181 RepID=UPI0022A6B6A0|nr:ly6/PLAUR domain-containing protein 8 [Peromyscus californicus insignis]
MKGILVAGVFVAFAITVIDSLSCRQCYSPIESCSNEVTQCDEGSLSCVESLVNSTLGGSHYLYQNRSCSANNCTEGSTQVAFTVHVFDDQRFHFESQCCQAEACNDTSHETGTQVLTNTQCSACYSYNTTTCQEKTRQCFQGERCVHITAEFVNGTERNTVELKGCSDISESTCETLAPGNTTVGEFFFQSVKCENATIIPVTTNTPPASTGVKTSFTSSVFGSLLLLKLLF